MEVRRRAHSAREIFAIPAAIGVASGAGLVISLIDDGWWDVVGWIGLGIAPLIAIICLMRRSPTI